MGRIVPPGLDLSDSSVVRALSDELNFTVNVAPGSAAIELTSTLVQTLETHHDELRNRYSVAANPVAMSNSCGPSWPEPQQTASDWRIRNTRELEAAATVVELHVGKGEDRLWELLSDAGLAVRSGDWWGLHPELAWLYMCALTDKLARRNFLTPITDQYIAHIESLTWTDNLFASVLLGNDRRTVATVQGGRREQVGLIALRLVIPDNLGDVPIKKIIRLRQRYAADFDAFCAEVADLARSLDNELVGIADPDVLATYIDYETRRRFQQPLTDLQKAMRGLGVDTTVTTLTSKFALPSSAAIAGGVLTDHPVVVAGGALAFGTAALMRNFQQGRRRIAPSAASYLWRVDHTINPDNLLRRMVDRKYLILKNHDL